jgi:hypothetical protein
MIKLIKYHTLIIFLTFVGQSLHSQNATVTGFFKHSFSIQYNNVYDRISEIIWHDFTYIKKRMFSIRYSYWQNPNLSFGPEISGFDYTCFQTDTTLLAVNNNLNIGGFCRYSLRKPQNLKPFVETGLYYQRGWSYVWLTFVDGISHDVFNRVGVYAAPGISICILKNRLNLDLMYKFSNLEMANFKKSVFSWRLTYNFNIKGC